VLGGVVRSELVSPKVVDDRLACRESLEVELELFLDLMVVWLILLRAENTEGIAKVVVFGVGVDAAAQDWVWRFGD
jgi:hypothetical protein